MSTLVYKTMLSTFKKYNKQPREVQVNGLKALCEVWDSYKVHALLAHVGTGKSLMARAIQEQTQAAILTADNGLVDQYAESMEDLNVLKGAARYKCQFGWSCADQKAAMGECCGGGCPYVASKARATLGDDTIYNPMSYLVNLRAGNIEPAPVLIVDEAHKLPGFLRMLGTIEIKEPDADFTAEDLESPATIIKYAEKTRDSLKKLVSLKKAQGLKDGLKDDVEMLDKLSLILYALQKNPDDFFCHVKTTRVKHKDVQSLVVEPVRPPKAWLDLLLLSKKILLMSGTIRPHHIEDLMRGAPYSYTELPAVIPVGSRLIKVVPCAPNLNKDTPVTTIAKAILDILADNQGTRGIIHATYALANKLKPYMPDYVICHDKHDKGDALGAFKDGRYRWLLASGMAEGIDLAGDLARINIITKLQWPNLGDPFVQKRKSLRDGDLWYLSTTLEHLVQAAGRTTRGVDDSSLTFVLDPGVSRLIKQIKDLTAREPHKQKQYLPASLLDALRF